MIGLAALAFVYFVQATEVLPIDSVMAEFEAADPDLKKALAEAEEDISRLGPVEPGWATSGLSVSAAITRGGGDVSQHVLGEWEKGGHGINVPGDRPLGVPHGRVRYTVRPHDGPITYHSYFRASADFVVHTFGTNSRVGDAACSSSQGIEIISRKKWRGWSTETTLTAFVLARAARDDRRTYCTLYRPAADGRFAQVSYTPEGRAYVAVNEDPQTFVVTSRPEATARLFSEENRPRVARLTAPANDPPFPAGP